MTENYVPKAFDITTDVIADPLIPRGIYHGSVTNLKLKLDKHRLDWEITFKDNEGLMFNDGKTPVDGAKLMLFNYLPTKEEDAKTMSPSGKQTKMQSKINMLAKFAKGLGITKELRNIDTIALAVQEAKFLGMAIDASVVENEYQGEISNQIDRLTLPN